MWTVIKQVVDLKAPAIYRLRAVFRWIGAHDKVLGTMTRTSPSCYQPELRALARLMLAAMGVRVERRGPAPRTGASHHPSAPSAA